MSALRLINETTGTNVSSVSLTDVFSADFDIYKIEQTDYTPLSATSQSVMRLINASGSVISSSNYEYGSLFQPSYSSFVFDNSTSSTFIMDGLGNDQNDTVGGGAIYYLFNPFSSTQKTKQSSNTKTPVLDNFGRDITALAEKNKLDPVIGRDKEIQRVSQILSRRKKNNPLIKMC